MQTKGGIARDPFHPPSFPVIKDASRTALLIRFRRVGFQTRGAVL